MTRTASLPHSLAGHQRIHAAVEQILDGERKNRGTIRSIRRVPSPYRSSYLLEDLIVAWQDGAQSELVFKDLSRDALLAAAVEAKPAFLYDPQREIETYRAILGPGKHDSPHFIGAVVSPEEEIYWLFVERIRGVELYQIGELHIWHEAARRLAGLHTAFLHHDQLDMLAHTAHLLRYDRAWYRTWLERALAFTDGRITPVAFRYDEIVDGVLALPRTVLHGELFASNVMVQRTASGTRVALIDWEMAAVGPPLSDLAALIAGGWSERTKGELADSYFEAIRPAWPEIDRRSFIRALDCCRHCLAIQRLGWSSTWSPPPQHGHDWLGEALMLASRLGIA